MSVRHVAAAVGPYCQKSKAAGARAEENPSVAKLGWGGNVHAAMTHAPQLAARVGVVGERRQGRRAHELWPAVDLNDCRRRVCFLAVAVQGAVIEVSVLFPHGGTRLLV